ncbi:hypothetical protein [Streptomyces sp. AK02-01A]|uniref:hypothetical protein n=1 Tax=Streptomyces sp. AK02-01A TaxID=3028648 RepID=UPI0029B8E8DB|nr:hypothetical protein [Streptomyces sp. AK02-01A]MDX3854604.1 hypothetical protein [Streptomyces sp. AK02-01A]
MDDDEQHTAPTGDRNLFPGPDPAGRPVRVRGPERPGGPPDGCRDREVPAP